MSEDGETKKVVVAHDREVRAIALEHAVNLAERQRVAGGLGDGGCYDAEAIVAMAETFRAFLTVPGGHSHFLYQDGETVRASLPPKGALALPGQVSVVSAPTISPPASDAFAGELREFRQFIEGVIAEERSGSAGKAA